MKTLIRSLGVLLFLASSGASAQNYAFDCFTNYRGVDCTVGESQLKINVLDQGSSVSFLFSNTGPAQGAITDVYFDWASSASALTGGTIQNGAGVSMAWGAEPSNLPGGWMIGFTADAGADSSPAHPGGVDAGEWVNFNFAGSYASVLAGLNTGDLRVGVQFKGLATGGAESFVVTPVPEPETYAMLLAGLGLMGFVVRRRRAGARIA